jgi:hypothetical protein
LFLAGVLADRYFFADRFRWLQMGVAAACAVIGIGIMMWAVAAQARSAKKRKELTAESGPDGEGSPAVQGAHLNPDESAPPRPVLVTDGPYHYCRNPILLGSLVYCLGIGIYFGSLGIGVVMLLLAYKIGSLYVKLVEESRLRRAFGREFDEYKIETPFLIPQLWTQDSDPEAD